MRPIFLGKNLLFVTAHPDDESYLTAGTIYQNHQLGGTSSVICATLGDRGRAYVSQEIGQRQLKALRKTELQAAANYIGVTELCLLNLPDCGLVAAKDKLERGIARIVKRICPDFIISFGADGITGHKDHVITGQKSKKIARKFKIPFVAICAAPALIAGFEKTKGRRKYGQYYNHIHHQNPNIKIKIDSQIKLKTLECHKSQFKNDPFYSIPKKAATQILHYEYYWLKNSIKRSGR